LPKERVELVRLEYENPMRSVAIMQIQESERRRLFWLFWSVLTVVAVVLIWNVFTAMG
jgi:hypothetical protein